MCATLRKGGKKKGFNLRTRKGRPRLKVGMVLEARIPTARTPRTSRPSLILLLLLYYYYTITITENSTHQLPGSGKDLG